MGCPTGLHYSVFFYGKLLGNTVWYTLEIIQLVGFNFKSFRKSFEKLYIIQDNLFKSKTIPNRLKSLISCCDEKNNDFRFKNCFSFMT